MACGHDAALMRSIQALYGPGTVAGMSDGQLLECFGSGRHEAFEAIVARHGRLVMDVCRHALDDLDDAQDAFQATFLVLARRAGSIRRGDSLPSWLFGVARRVSARARSEAARRRVHERTAAERAGGVDRVDERRDYEALHEEVDRLPERYRLPVVLCYLEGLTYEAAAERLRCPLGTLSVRLSRARDRLKSRLIRRGLTASIGLLAASGTASAGVPVELVEQTARLATPFIGGRVVDSGAVPAAVAGLATGVLDMMRMTIRLEALATLGLMAAFVASVGVLASGRADGPEDGPASARVRKALLSPDDLARLQGTWVLSGTEADQHPTKITIRGNTVATDLPWSEGILSLDPTTIPKRIEIAFRKIGPEDSIRWLEAIKRSILDAGRQVGVYRLEDDTLTLFMVNAGQGPPPGPERGTKGQVDLKGAEKQVWKRVPPVRAVDSDLARLQGEWVVVDPGRLNKDRVSSRWTIVSTRLFVRDQRANGTEDENVSEIRLVEGAEVPGIDLVQKSRPVSRSGVRGEEREVVERCLYRIEGDMLYLCGLEGLDRPRPSSFEAPGADTTVLRRPGKVEGSARPKAAPAPKAEAGRGDLGRMQGTWVAEHIAPGANNTFTLTVSGDGATVRMQGSWVAKSILPGANLSLALTFSGGVMTSTSAAPTGKGRGDFTIALDESTSPRAFDVSIPGATPERLVGIYDLQGDTLRLRFVPPDRPRPTEFGAGEAELVVLKRRPLR